MGRRSKSLGSPTTHTVVLSTVIDMYWKLHWDVLQFEKLQRSGTAFAEPLAYAAINVCIAATSLADWAVSACVSRRRDGGKRISEQEVRQHIYGHIIQQKMCEAIANTAKHSRLNEGAWAGGSVRLDFDEPTEFDQGGWVLRHLHEGGEYESVALNAFMNLESNWWSELQNLGFPFDRTPPAWRQAQLRAIFGSLSIEPTQQG